jgi:hypothetical protein
MNFVDPLGLERIRECFFYYLGQGRQEYQDERETILYSFNWPGAEIGVGPGIDPGPRGRGPVRPIPDIVPKRAYVDRYDAIRIDIYNVTTTWDNMEVLCQGWELDECTGEIDYSTFAEGRHQFRENEKTIEYLVSSRKVYRRNRILDLK